MQLLRRTFLTRTVGWSAGLTFGLGGVGRLSAQTPPKVEPLPLDDVRDVVGASHRDIDRVTALVNKSPTLVNACWDWGGGDFETPIQAAAHTGRRAIAEFLLSRGARLDVFAAAMLGHLAFVEAAFASYPHADEIHGPHGFTLLHCARNGGEAAQPVVDFLLARGVPDVKKRPLY